MKEFKNSGKDTKEFIIEHEAAAILLDDYSNDELEAVERKFVEHHLLLCAECQELLDDIILFRRVIKKQKIHFQAEMTFLQPDGGLVDSLVPSIRQRIGNHQKVEMGRRVVTSHVKVESSPDSSSPASRRRKRAANKASLWLMGVCAAAILCIIVCAAILLPLLNSHPGPQQTVVSTPARFPWELNKEQTSIYQGTNVFAIKHMDIVTPKYVRFFYTFRSAQNEVPQIRVFSQFPSQQNTLLNAKIQPLGQLNSFQVGVIDVPYVDKVGQTFVMEGKFSLEGPTWHLSPVKQVTPDKPGSEILYIDQKDMPEISWNFGNPIGTDTTAFFQAQTTNGKTSNSRVYIIIGDTVKKITEAEYQKLATPPQKTSPCQGCGTPISISTR